MRGTDKLNITHCVETLHRGGLEHVVLDLVERQQAQGHRCQVVCLFEGGLLVERFQSLGVPVRVCHKKAGPDLAAVRRLRSYVRSHATDVLHTHNRTVHYYAVLATLGSRPRAVVNTSHGMGADSAKDRRERLFAFCASRTDRIVAVSEMVRERMQRRGLPTDKLVVAYNGIEADSYPGPSAQARSRLRAELGLPADARLLGTVGRLDRLKDPATLIRAFSRLQAERSDTALLIIGDGALRSDLEELVAELRLGGNVRFLGDRDDVPELLAGLDLFAMSSLSEGFSIALLEACASSLPIVATRVGGNPEIIIDGTNGLLVPSADPAALARAIQALLDDPVRARRLGAAGRKWVLEHATLDAMTARYAEIYAQCR